MDVNPYESPKARNVVRIADDLDWCGYVSVAPALIVPILVGWDVATLHSQVIPRLPMENWGFNVSFTIAVFIFTSLSIPLAVAGLYSRAWRFALIGLLLGSIGSLATFYVKFLPVLMHYLT